MSNQITSIILGVALIFFVAKKFKKGIGLYVSLLLIVFYIALPFVMSNDIHRLDNDMAYTRQNQKLTLYSQYKKGYGKFERQIKNVSNKAEVGDYQSVLYILENQKMKVISLENEAKNDKFISKIKNQTYLETYISTHYTLIVGDGNAYFEKNSSSEIVKLHRINNHMLYFKYKKDYYFIYILEKQKDIKVYELSNDRDLKFYFAPDPFEMSNSQTSNEDTNESDSQNQTEEANQETTEQESDTTDLENDPERVYFEKVYELLKSQNKLDNPCFDYQYDAKGYPYAVVNTQGNRIKALVFNKQSGDDYEVVLEEYNQNEGKSSATLIDFYLVNTKTLEVTDQQRDYW